VRELWDRAFAPRAAPPIDPHRLTAWRSPRAGTYDAPHPDVGTLAYHDISATGYAYGFRVSSRPGFWESYVVDAAGAHPLEPQWYSGVTYNGFHDTRPRLLAGTGREIIEVDLTTRLWRRREFDKPVRGVCYFESGIAVGLIDEVLLLDDLDAEPALRVPTTTRNAQLASFHEHRALWVAVGEESNVFLARRDGQLVVLGVLEGGATGGGPAPDGDFLVLDDAGAIQFAGWAGAIASAPPWGGEPLQLVKGPRIELAP
jgi:hypothetical protein